MCASADWPELATSRLNGSLFVVLPSIVAMLAMGPPANGAGRPRSAVRIRAEAPGPGDTDVSGTVLITLTQGQGKVRST
jgi:hypothetical protein